MDGIHDLGGVEGFGAVEVEDHEPVFHEAWEGRVFGLAAAASMNLGYGTPRFRHAIERMRPAHYLTASYYEKWMTAVATLLVERGTIDASDLEHGSDGEFRLSGPSTVPTLDDAGADVTTPRFRVGDAVRVRATARKGHTRCPRYVRGRSGQIVRYDGACNFDDIEAHASGPRREPLYGVRFDASELWGESDDTNFSVTVDLFDAYLEAP